MPPRPHVARNDYWWTLPRARVLETPRRPWCRAPQTAWRGNVRALRCRAREAEVQESGSRLSAATARTRAQSSRAACSPPVSLCDRLGLPSCLFRGVLDRPARLSSDPPGTRRSRERVLRVLEVQSAGKAVWTSAAAVEVWSRRFSLRRSASRKRADSTVALLWPLSVAKRDDRQGRVETAPRTNLPD